MANPIYSILGTLFKSSGSMVQIITTLKYWRFWLPLFIILSSFIIEFGFLFIAFTETGDVVPLAKEGGAKIFAIDSKILTDTERLIAFEVTETNFILAPIYFWFGFLALLYQVFADFVMVWFIIMVCHWIAQQLFGNTNSNVIIYTVVGIFLLCAGMLEVIYVKLFFDRWILPLSGTVESLWLLLEAYILPHIEKPASMVAENVSVGS